MNRVPESIGARRLSPKWNVAGSAVRAVPVTLDFSHYCLSWSCFLPASVVVVVVVVAVAELEEMGISVGGRGRVPPAR